MSYYGVSVLVTIIVTTLIAFYLLYKAKELNLGIMVAIAAGSIVLGCSFSPAFKSTMRLLVNTITINKKVALVLSLLVVLLIFLLFICILSFLISIIIPKRFTSIDCGVYIDKIIAGTKRSIVGIFDKMAPLAKNSRSVLKNIVSSTYNLKNKLKKPVDTNQIIDTMGIEKSEDAVSVSINAADMADAFESTAAAVEMDIAAEGVQVEVADETDSGTSDSLIEEVAGSELAEDEDEAETAEEVIDEAEIAEEVIDEEVIDEAEIAEEVIDEAEIAEEVIDEAEIAEEVIDEAEIAEEVIGEAEIAEEAIDEAETAEEVIDEAEIAEEAIDEAETAEEVIDEAETAEAAYPAEMDEVEIGDHADTNIETIDEINEIIDIDEADALEEIGIAISTPEIQPENPGSDINSLSSDMDLYQVEDDDIDINNNTLTNGLGESPASASVIRAFEYKDKGRKDLAIECYLEAMDQGPDKEMIFWIVLDICSLYKQLGLTELAKSILEGLVEKYEAVIRPEIKEEIIKNLK